MRGATPGAVTRAIQSGALSAAVVNGRIDADHPAVTAWLNLGRAPKWPATPRDERALARAELAAELAGGDADEPDADAAPPPPRRVPGAVAASAVTSRRASHSREERQGATLAPAQHEIPDLEAVLDLTLRELTDRWGHAEAFATWMIARHRMAQATGQELKNAELRGSLIRRDLVVSSLVGHVDALHRRLLSDTPKTLAVQVRSEASHEDAERVIYERLQKLVKGERDSLLAAIRRMGAEVQSA